MNNFAALRRIETVWDAAIADIDSKLYPGIVASLNARFPAVLECIADLAVADGVSPATRFKAAELLNRVLAHLMHVDQKKVEASAVSQKAQARREGAKARHARLRVEELNEKRLAEKRAAVKARKFAEAIAVVEKGSNQ